MPDGNGAGAPQDDNQQPIEGQPTDAGASNTQTETSPEPTSGPESKPDSANKRIKDFVSERGITVEDLLQKLTDDENAQKTELERLTGERDDFKSRYESLEAKYRESQAASAFTDAASKANARSPRTLFRAVKSDIEYDDDGNATNIDALIESLKADEPDLFRTVEGDGGKGARVPASNDMNNLFRKMRDENTRK